MEVETETAEAEPRKMTGFEAAMQASLGGALKGGSFGMRAADDEHFKGNLFWTNWSNSDCSNLWGKKTKGSDGLPVGETLDIHIYVESLLNHHAESSFDDTYPTADIRLHLLAPKEMVEGLYRKDPVHEQALVDMIAREHPLIGKPMAAYRDEETEGED